MYAWRWIEGRYRAVAMPWRSSAAITRSRSVPRGELDDVDEPGADVVGVVGERQLEPVDVREQLAVAGRRGPAQRQDRVELLELADPERRADVVDAVVEAEPCMVEPATAVGATLVAEADELPPRLLGVRRHDPAFAGRDLLVRVEGEDRVDAVRADAAALVLGAERLAGVLDQREAVPRRRARAAGRARTGSRRCRRRRSPSSAR